MVDPSSHRPTSASHTPRPCDPAVSAVSPAVICCCVLNRTPMTTVARTTVHRPGVEAIVASNTSVHCRLQSWSGHSRAAAPVSPSHRVLSCVQLHAFGGGGAGEDNRSIPRRNPRPPPPANKGVYAPPPPALNAWPQVPQGLLHCPLPLCPFGRDSLNGGSRTFDPEPQGHPQGSAVLIAPALRTSGRVCGRTFPSSLHFDLLRSDLPPKCSIEEHVRSHWSVGRSSTPKSAPLPHVSSGLQCRSCAVWHRLRVPYAPPQPPTPLNSPPEAGPGGGGGTVIFLRSTALKAPTRMSLRLYCKGQVWVPVPPGAGGGVVW